MLRRPELLLVLLFLRFRGSRQFLLSLFEILASCSRVCCNRENNLVNGVSQYASNLEYRASGAVKDMDFGNGAHQHADFNSRLLPLSSTLSSLTGGASMTWSYTYYNDGLLRKTSDAADPRFDRLQDYDHLGRLKEAYSGREARVEVASSPYPDSPYRQTYQYDVWNNQTSKSGRFWRLSLGDSSPYVNNRRQVASLYDAEGNSLSMGNNVQRYDAAAKQIHFENWRSTVGGSPNNPAVQPTIEIDQTYDGNGLPARRLEKQGSEELINGGPNLILSRR